jgi:hypothetical protein
LNNLLLTNRKLLPKYFSKQQIIRKKLQQKFLIQQYQHILQSKLYCYLRKSSLNDTLEILSTITSPVNSEQFNDNLMKFLVTVVRLPYLEAE